MNDGTKKKERWDNHPEEKEALRKRNKINFTGRHHSPETRKLLSDKKKQYIREHPEYLEYLRSICNNCKGKKKPNFSGVNHPRFGKRLGVIRECRFCKKKIYRIRYFAKKFKGSFCNRKCFKKFKSIPENNYNFGKKFPKMSKRFSGKNNPMYGRGGKLSPNYGKQLSDEVKMKLSQMRIGEKNPFWGKHHSKKTIDKICKKIGGKNNYFYGKHRSEEFRAKLSETQRRLYKEGKRIPSMLGKKHSRNTKKLISAKRVEFYKTHKPTYPKPFFVPELGHFVRSSWEKEVGTILQNAGISYGYETKTFDLGNSSYTPDFETSPKTFIEVKGFLRRESEKKMKRFRRLYPNIKLIGIGTGNNEIYDVHLKWEEKEKIVDILNN